MINFPLIDSNKSEFLKQIVLWSWIALAIAALYQFCFWDDPNNMISLACVTLSWLLLTNTFLKTSMLRSYPLSGFIIIGFTATQFYFPLLFTSLEGKPINFNLQLPLDVFFHSTACLVVLLTAHTAYRLLNKRPGYKVNTIFTKAGLFDAPAVAQIWIMGVLGLGATFYVWLYAPSIAGAVTGSPIDKIVQGLIPFSYAPFLIPFGRLYGIKEPEMKKLILPLLVFSLALFMISLGRNSRGGFMIGFASVGLAYALGLLLGKFKTAIFTWKNGAIAVILFWAFTGPVADIGTAMVLVRGQRSDISYSKLIDLTLMAYQDKKAINQYRLNDLNETGDWDETYLDNPIMARFSNLKFNDMSLVQAAKIGDNDPEMLKFTTDYLWASLPQPLLDAFGIEIDKEMLKSVSIGDYLYYRAGAPVESLGGYRTGHFAGTGMATFGLWYLLILGLGMIPVFFLFDQFFIHQKTPYNTAHLVPHRYLSFSLCGMLALDGIFRFLPTESVISTINFLMRDWIQIIILYLIVFHFTRLLVNFFHVFKTEETTKAIVIR